MKFGIGIIPSKNFKKTIELIKLAENNGFKYAWISDNTKIDTYKLLRNISFETESIKIGYGVTNPYIRNPEKLASEMLNINEMYANRLTIGIGVGNKDMLDELQIQWKNPISTLEKSIDTINKHTNKSIPIYIEAQSSKLLELSEKKANGVLITASHPKDYEIIIPKIKKSNNSLKFDICSYATTSINEDSKTAKDSARIVVAFVIAGSTQQVLKRHNISSKISNRIYTCLCKGNIGEATRLISDDMLNKFSIAGNTDEIISKISKLQESGVTQFIASAPIGRNMGDSIKLFGEVIKSF